jgi:hypothetical protein
MEEHSREQVDGHWLVLSYRNNPPIRLDIRMIDRVFAEDDTLILAVEDFPIGLPIIAGAETARSIAERLAPYTRSAPITKPEAYEDAKRRLDVARGFRSPALPPVLLVGDDPVIVGDETLSIGASEWKLSDVIQYADRGRHLPLSDGSLQSGLAILVIADKMRQYRDDVSILSERVAAYEAFISEPAS